MCSPFLDEDLDDLAFRFGLDLVHQLHRFDDADDLTFADALADLDEGGRLGRRRPIEGANERRADERSRAFGGPVDGRRRGERDGRTRSSGGGRRQASFRVAERE